MNDDEEPQFPDEGPYWTPEEGAVLLSELEEAFPDAQLPEGDHLVKNTRHSDAESVVEACAGKMWRQLSVKELVHAQDYGYHCTSEAFRTLLPAYLRSAIPPHDWRLDLEGMALYPLSPGSDRERLSRRLDVFSPEQLKVVYRFLELTHRRHTSPDWTDTELGQFWRDYLRTRRVSLGPA